MPIWKIPVCWEMTGFIYAEFPTLEEAVEYARDREGIIPIPIESEYSEGSWDLCIEGVDEVRDLYNGGRRDEALNDVTDALVTQEDATDICISDMSIESLLER